MRCIILLSVISILFALGKFTDQLHQTISANGVTNAWISFHDKGQSGAFYKYVEKDERNLPVYQPYIEDVTSITQNAPRAVSKWLNAISIRASHAELLEISRLSFVKEVDVVRSRSRPQLQNPPPSHFSSQDKHINRRADPGSDNLDYGNSAVGIEMLNIQFMHQKGYTGAGVKILVLDSGYYTVRFIEN